MIEKIEELATYYFQNFKNAEAPDGSSPEGTKTCSNKKETEEECGKLPIAAIEKLIRDVCSFDADVVDSR